MSRGLCSRVNLRTYYNLNFDDVKCFQVIFKLILKISDITVNLVLISGVKNVQFVIGFTKKKIQKLMKDLSVGARNVKIKLIRRNLN